MRFVSAVPFVLTTFQLAAALPREYAAPSRRSTINILDDVLAMDSPAFEDPDNPGNTLVQLQALVTTQKVSLAPLITGIQAFAKTLGVDLGDGAGNAAKRLELFATLGVQGKNVPFSVAGCSSSGQLQPTGAGGVAVQNVSVGTCGDAEVTGTVKMGALRSPVTFNMYPGTTDGFGVISDIDDTVKISHVLDKAALIKATLLEDPTPVTGMPELYASLAQSLNNPVFMYVSGSPVQLYPFLQGFIQTTFNQSAGPIMLRNLSSSSIGDLSTINLGSVFVSNKSEVLDYKLSMIDRIHGMYPGKKFLAIGDSTEKDPETYGAAIRKFGDFISCAWIRVVDGANNTDDRFAAAFDGVDSSKFKLYNDTEIPSLADIDVAGGSCN